MPTRRPRSSQVNYTCRRLALLIKLLSFFYYICAPDAGEFRARILQLSCSFLTFCIIPEYLGTSFSPVTSKSIQAFIAYYNASCLRNIIKTRETHTQCREVGQSLENVPPTPIFTAHFRKAAALVSLGRTEEALVAHCVAVSLDKSALSAPTALKHDITRLLHRLFVPQYRVHQTTTMTTPFRKRRKVFTVRSMSDCEDESSSCGEEENFLHVPKRRRCGGRHGHGSDVIPPPNARLRSLLERIHQEVHKIRRADSRLSPPQVNPSLIEASDFDCVLCCRTLWKPVVTPCGHTYCSICLDRCMDYKQQCPLCMFHIEDTMSLARHGATYFLEVAMQRFIPVAYTKRKRQELEPSVPIFICTTAFPSVPCPLLVSEPRYRLMVRQAIESGDRHFGIAQPSGKPPQNGRQQYFEYGTMLDIRDCVLLGNGCSILSTVGSRRFRVLVRGEKDGYDTAKVEYICDSPISRERTGYVAKLHERVLGKAMEWFDRLPETYKTEILRSFGHMPQVEEEWVTERDGPAWAWWIIAILPLNQQLKGTILMETNLEKRLLAIDKTLAWQDKSAAQKRQSAEPCSPCGSDGLPDCPTVDCCQRGTSSTHLDERSAPSHATHFLM
ncbi:LON peptidase N-terminal domain and RING finger protein 3 isoform X2 [Phlebotomus argentipes]|uniref:LON peptidase N-terminal domain and RING finger protein 3 isoform X2 n=1 Tax=Phlebotomus argentipes TaxID=94469 RepID=UPI002892CA40|nr:LON peptidase N-terminal domain and RING finger protein 3 isoform X2 [Phlebotomus argentipes]